MSDTYIPGTMCTVEHLHISDLKQHIQQEHAQLEVGNLRLKEIVYQNQSYINPQGLRLTGPMGSSHLDVIYTYQFETYVPGTGKRRSRDSSSSVRLFIDSYADHLHRIPVTQVTFRSLISVEITTLCQTPVSNILVNLNTPYLC